jgi:6-phosphogluconolactonase
MLDQAARIRSLASASDLRAAVAAIANSALRSAIEQRGHASLVLPGGKTPELFLPALAAVELPWHDVIVTLSDERWVDESDALSNARLLHERLLRGPAAGALFVPLRSEAATPREGAVRAEATLAQIEDPYDLVVLGMGEDGHVASLFPGSAELPIGLDPDGRARCIAIAPPPTVEPNLARISLTLAELCKGRHILLVIAGARKMRVLLRALSAGAERTPVRALFECAKVPIDVLWLRNA